MDTFLSILKSRKNPLDSMESRSNGLYPFPVEIWQDILLITTEPDYETSGTSLEDDEINSYPVFSSETEDALRDPRGVYSSIIFKTRLSIILVCKSWYYIGMPILWSHLKLDEVDWRKCCRKG